ncbi:MAG: hypothetical protein JSV49_02820 [Thermoplasmata archaeon]|nr:MAG: hypothetical protein JSV49_02820 [Thermoplasmata archaeon]
MPKPTQENQVEPEETDAEPTEKSSDEKKLIAGEDERLKKGIALGALALGLYYMDRLLAEERTVETTEGEQITIRKGILEEFFE